MGALQSYASLDTVPYIEACQVDMSLDAAWRILRDRGGYDHLQPVKGDVFIVIPEPTSEKYVEPEVVANRVATELFAPVEPNPVSVNPVDPSTNIIAFPR